MTCNMGDTITSNGENIILRVLAPQQCAIKLIHNGNMISENKTMNTAWDIKEKGIYRVECWIGDRGWIFSNHIRVN